MPLQPKPHYSFDDYLLTERAAEDEKHEYVAGHVYAKVSLVNTQRFGS